MFALQLTFQKGARLISVSVIFSQSNVIECIKSSEILLDTYFLTLNSSTETMINSVFFKRKFYFFALPTSFDKKKYYCFTHYAKNAKWRHTLSALSVSLKMFNTFYTYDFHLELYKEYCWKALLEIFDFPKSGQPRQGVRGIPFLLFLKLGFSSEEIY